MKKSVNLYLNNEDSIKKLKIIKSLGYDEFFTGMYDKKESLTWREQLEFAQKLGLECTMMHCSYIEPELNAFWEYDDVGEKVMQSYIAQINECGEFCDNFVVHLNGSPDVRQSEIGLKRIKTILEVCEKYNINLCIENLYSKDEIPYVFEHIKHPLLKICYDCGHRNFLTPDFDICKNYGKYITTLHLHENDGASDQHKKLIVGSPVYQKLMQDITYLSPCVVLASEIKATDEGWQRYLEDNLTALKNLDK